MDPDKSTNSPANQPPEVSSVAPTPVPGAQTTAQSSTKKSGNKKLAIIISIIVGLLVIAGIVLAVVLSSTENEDNSSTTGNSQSSNAGSANNGGAVNTAPTERELVCKVENVEGTPINMILSIHFDNQGDASKIVYEYDFTDGETIISEEMLPQLQSSLEDQLSIASSELDVTVSSELTDKGGARLTVINKSGGKLPISALGYGSNYDSAKTALELECATYDGAFSTK